MTDRNRVSDEQAARNRLETNPPGGYTFHAPIDEAEIGRVGLVFACVRLGDHAHVDVGSGFIVAAHPGTRVNRGEAGHLILRWHEWELLRALLAVSPVVHIAEVERPTQLQLQHHVPGWKPPTSSVLPG